MSCREGDNRPDIVERRKTFGDAGQFVLRIHSNFYMRVHLTILVTMIFLVIMISALTAEVRAQDPSLKYCLIDQAVAAGGYDVVSYFVAGKAEQGNRNIVARFDHVTYYFSSDEHRKMFEKQPARFVPQFGGWCSMTLAMGRATKPSYDNFLIRDGKLYLFERTLSVNGRELWLRDPDGNARRAAITYRKYAEGELPK
jgi:hypothetical protein